MNIASHKKTIAIIIIVLASFFAYWFFVLSKSNVPSSVDKNGKPQATASNTPYDKDFVSSLLGLNSVDLDVSIFKTNVYRALSYPEVPFVVNYSRESGRYNPFLPIGYEGSNTTSDVTTQTKPVEITPVATTTPTATSTAKPTPKKF